MSQYIYYCPQRPPELGAIPTNGLVSVVAYEERQYHKALHRNVWGRVTYNRPLTSRELYDYELLAEPLYSVEYSDMLDIRCAIIQRAVNDYKRLVSHKIKPNAQCNLAEIERFFMSDYCDDIMDGMPTTPAATLESLHKWREKYLRKERERRRKKEIENLKKKLNAGEEVHKNEEMAQD